MIKPLPKTEKRHEILTFQDGSELEVDQQMRADHERVYKKAVKRAVKRRFKKELK